MNSAVISAVVRYILLGVSGYLAAHGHLSDNANSYISSNADQLIGVGLGALTWIEGLIATHKLSSAATSAAVKPSVTTTGVNR